MYLADSFAIDFFTEWWDVIKHWLMFNGARIPFLIAIFFIGKYLSRKIAVVLSEFIKRRQHDDLLANFLEGVVYYTLLIAVSIAVLGQLGMNVASLVAVFGAAGLAVGLALKDSLSNFASGVMLVLFHPFKVGDYVLGAGVAGTIEGITIFNTIMRTPDNQRIIVPNSMLMGDVITNVTANPTRRVDLTMGISYDDDIDKAKEVIWQVLKAESRLLSAPEATVAVHTLGESSVDIVVRPWVKTEDYWDVYWSLTEELKKAFDLAGISIPFPQRDVHVKHPSEAIN